LKLFLVYSELRAAEVVWLGGGGKDKENIDSTESRREAKESAANRFHIVKFSGTKVLFFYLTHPFL
jgi:hypothetical protein